MTTNSPLRHGTIMLSCYEETTLAARSSFPG